MGNRERGGADVMLGQFVERRINDLGVFSAHANIRHLFGTLVDEQNDQFDFLMIFADAACDLFQQRRFTRFGRRDDQSALSFSDRRE